MKKAKRRKGKRMLVHKDLYNIQFFQIQGRMINSAKTEIMFFRGREVCRVIIYDYIPRRYDAIIRWHDGRYFSFSHKDNNSLQAKPYRMTLAKYKQLNDRLAK